MSPQEAADRILRAVSVTREDIARVKGFVLEHPDSPIDTVADAWLKAQNAVATGDVHLEADTVGDEIALLARSCGLRLALYQAVWELVSSGDLLWTGATETWRARATWRTSRGGAGLSLDRLACPYPSKVCLPPVVSEIPQDVDVFLTELDVHVHHGVREAVRQALACFRRGLYLPSLAMLTAGVEAAWIECGQAVARKLANSKLKETVDSEFRGLGAKVTEINDALDTPHGKALIKSAGIARSRLLEAQVWTTVLRDRRNALHWGKARSFVADHGDVASLLLSAPIHLGTLQTIRDACS